MKKIKTINLIVLSSILLVSLSSFIFSNEIKGWFLAGSAPSKYEIGTEYNNEKKGNVAYLKSTEKNIKNEFGTIMQSFTPEIYHGKNIKLTAYIKSSNIKDWAGMWMRIDGPNKETLGFDNMQNRPIIGSNDWTKYEIIMKIPVEAINISYGVLISETGEILIDKFNFEIVDDKEKSTNTNLPTLLKEPTNTNFDN